ncbi:hypothetical protein EX30DRAFT_364867 [Ascodesmis nigricans]|uniref:Cupin type-2 domain-containing protein n=1 Tax=Ascodesmis nigricans TaxID=341454 RepID=A0A4V3SIH4_9PEZI|nr:hypothetical protein EX30DRAFT_364867 [Ascodesmis nigricans]
MSSTNTPPFPTPHRILTGHDSTGKSIFLSDLPIEIEIARPEAASAHLGLIYTTNSVPVNLNNNADIDGFTATQRAPFQLVTVGGTRLLITDMMPNAEGLFHRTESVDFITIMEGEVELELDSGEKRRVRRGDTVVQRATMHKWRNISENDGWARMLCVLTSAEKVKLENGEVLSEDVSLLGIKSSD